ncbi:MAG: bacillithiol biosynthesis deacetylase BshB1 [Bacteroidetes bacterium]|nr:bacillithiol biosynthesis deacetylase BshB1 [Bacteroidota bacterium]
MKLDILAIMAHPDDAELACGGTLIKHAEAGYKVGIIDLTHGEMGTRGSAEIRDAEAKMAGQILGLTIRENLDFKDVFFTDDEAHRLKVIEKIREYQPSIVITNTIEDRHPDHPKAAQLVKTAAFQSGFVKIETTLNGTKQEAWRPRHVFHVIQYKILKPDFVVNIKGYEEKKMKAIMAYASQFYNPESKEPETLIASKSFLELVIAKNLEFGNHALLDSGEGFISAFTPAVDDLFHLV